jgi:hypothetical protein
MTSATSGRVVVITRGIPLAPPADMVSRFLAGGGARWACTPRVKNRGYTQ